MLCSDFVISDVNAVPAVAGLPACCAGFVSFASVPAIASVSAFCRRPYCVGGPVVAFIPAVACDPAFAGSIDIAVDCVPAVAGIPLLLASLSFLIFSQLLASLC
jgi:hypothetical protein